MKKEKSPFGKYSQEQIEEAESKNFIILLGHDLFCNEEGRYTFLKEDAEVYHDQIRGGLMEILENGSMTEKQEAEVCLFFLKILPFRLH
jgi:hypothetical protein